MDTRRCSGPLVGPQYPYPWSYIWKLNHRRSEDRTWLAFGYIHGCGTKNCCCSVSQSCPTLWNSIDWSTPGFPVLHCLLEFAQTHVHWVSDAIQPSPPLTPFFSCSQSYIWVVIYMEGQLYMYDLLIRIVRWTWHSVLTRSLLSEDLFLGSFEATELVLLKVVSELQHGSKTL